jgi:lipopolysaccharide/colanic/teichoic acid biosynthesis glycosyltransferase
VELTVQYRGGDARLPVARSRAKRLFDVVLAATGLVVLSPILALIALAIVLDSGWPVLYSQSRTGFEGQVFRIWKFRTMVRNAEARRAELLELNEAPYPAFKIRNDPRLTRIGRFLRKSSADELPQLWNVLVGDMSLVGPRPLPTIEADLLDLAGRQRLLARPGITCFWQLSNRHADQSGFGDWLAKDLAYIQDWSLWRDVVILARTAQAVVRMTGQ